jgi:hypothetical protein
MVQITVSICPVYRYSSVTVWAKCPSMEMTKMPAGAPDPPPSYGCCGTANPRPYCPAEVLEIPGATPTSGLLQELVPDFQKLDRYEACCPLINRGQVEELHSRECLFLAGDTEETHLVRLYLLKVTLPTSPQFYWPVGFEVTGYEPGLEGLAVGIAVLGEHPEYYVSFSNIRYDVLVEHNDEWARKSAVARGRP